MGENSTALAGGRGHAILLRRRDGASAERDETRTPARSVDSRLPGHPHTLRRQVANGSWLRVKPHVTARPVSARVCSWKTGTSRTAVSVYRMARLGSGLHRSWRKSSGILQTLTYNTNKGSKHHLFSLVSCATAYNGRSLPCLSHAPNLTRFPFHFHSKVVSKNFMGAGAGGQLFQRPPSYCVSS